MGVRRLGLTAAGLLVIVTVALALVTNGRAKPNLVHTCSATDRQFIDDARTNMTALELWSEQYQSGDASAEDVVGQAHAAAKIMRGTGPTDFSLRQTQRLVIGMLSEYAKGVQLHERHRDAGADDVPRLRARELRAHRAAAGAAAARQLGCDVSPLL